jgi:hypothetical protein
LNNINEQIKNLEDRLAENQDQSDDKNIKSLIKQIHDVANNIEDLLETKLELSIYEVSQNTIQILEQTFNNQEFKEKYIDPMSDEEKLMMDTTQMTKRFVDLYSQEVVRQKGDTTKKVTSLSQSDADDVLKRQADLQKKIELMRARRQGL